MDYILYSEATAADCKHLAKYRIAFLTELMGPQTDECVQTVTKELENYFSRAIDDKEYVGWLARHNGEIVGTGGMALRAQPGNFRNPTGRTGYIMNMYTVPAYRKQGICSALLAKLVDAGKAMGIDTFELHATTDGAPVYEKHGFVKHHEPTYRKYGVK